MLLQRNYDDHLLICLEEDTANKAFIELLDELVSRHFGKENTPYKVLREGNLWKILTKDTQAYATRCKMSTSTEKEDALSLQSMTIKHLFKQGKLNVVGEIILNLLKLHKYILTTTTYFMVNDYVPI